MNERTLEKMEAAAQYLRVYGCREGRGAQAADDIDVLVQRVRELEAQVFDDRRGVQDVKDLIEIEVRAERERCAKAMCKYCAQGAMVYKHPGVHDLCVIRHGMESMYFPCAAAAIWALPDE